LTTIFTFAPAVEKLVLVTKKAIGVQVGTQDIRAFFGAQSLRQLHLRCNASARLVGYHIL
jgi:hypothetical protein